MTRRSMLLAAVLAALNIPIIAAAAYTTRQLIAACRLWLKRHNVRRYATVTIIAGDGPPHQAYLDPDDGSTWRWAPGLYSWVSPAFEVSWSAGDVIPSFTSTIDGLHTQLYVGPWKLDRDLAIAALDRADTTSFGLMESYGTFLPSGDATATADGTGIAFVVQSQGVSAASTGTVTNYVTNPSLETYPFAWTEANFGVQQDASGAFGAHSAYTQVSISGNGVTAFGPATSGAPSNTPARASVYVRTNAGSNTGQLVGTGGTASVTLTTSWQRLSIYEPSGGAVANNVKILPSGSVAGDRIYWDGYMVTTGPELYPYFDGDTVDKGRYTYDWTGTAHASTSVRTDYGRPPLAAAKTQPQSPEMDVRVLLGTDVEILSTFTFPPEDVDSPGEDGQYWLDKPGKALYGPKDDSWPTEPAVEGFNLTRLVR